MKKVVACILVLVLCLASASDVMALGAAQKTLASALAVDKAGTVYSSVTSIGNFTGHMGAVIISTAGSVTITQQCSADNITWYDPVDVDGTALGQVVATQTVTAGKYVVMSPVFAPLIRYKIVEGNVAASAVTINLIAQRN